ncbi:MAG: biopolymer transporter ExbD [Mangrovicoccus sp.]|nr:biopolymer transporter ExbD [Mangrovicoccus sp.]
MRFAQPPRRPRAENIVPMINVVFLLLIFFLMTARIGPPDPFEVVLPSTEREAPSEAGKTLYVSADEALYYDGKTGDEALEALAARDPEAPTLLIKADAGLEATVMAALLRELAARGIKEATLLTVLP